MTVYCLMKLITRAMNINCKTYLSKLEKWAQTWKMTFNVTKCYQLRIGGKKSSQTYVYWLNGEDLEYVSHHPYLGVEIDKNLKWEDQVRSVTTKVNRSLGFIKRNLYMCPSNVKSAAYYTLVRPRLEYASIVWGPYLKKHKDEIEKIQQRESSACKQKSFKGGRINE